MLALLVFFVQVFVLNNLSITPLVAPMVYIVLIVMMPIDSSQWKMIGVAVAVGALMDLTMTHALQHTQSAVYRVCCAIQVMVLLIYHTSRINVKHICA